VTHYVGDYYTRERLDDQDAFHTVLAFPTYYGMQGKIARVKEAGKSFVDLLELSPGDQGNVVALMWYTSDAWYYDLNHDEAVVKMRIDQLQLSGSGYQNVTQAIMRAHEEVIRTSGGVIVLLCTNDARLDAWYDTPSAAETAQAAKDDGIRIIVVGLDIDPLETVPVYGEDKNLLDELRNHIASSPADYYGVSSFKEMKAYTDIANGLMGATVTKYYYTGDQRIAMRVEAPVDGAIESTLYYIASDHLASTSLVVAEDGTPLSRSRYTPFGEVAETQVWNGSAWQLAEVPTDPIEQTDYLYQGDYLERQLGIYFTADGRYYDPWLGKYLQPDPIGGPPLIPQAADRYQYAGNSPTGVGWIGTARNGGGIDVLSPSAWASVVADVGLKVAGRHLLLRPGVLTLRGFAPELFGAIAFQNFPGRYALLRNAPRRLVGNLGVYDITVRGDIIDDLGGGMFGFRRAGTMLDASGLKVARYERGLLLIESRWANAAVSMGLTFLIDVGFEGFGALTGTGRWGNPYWTPWQKGGQAFLVVSSDVALAGILVLSGLGWYITIPVAFTWAVIAEPLVFENVAPELYQEHYNLRPLQTGGG